MAILLINMEAQVVLTSICLSLTQLQCSPSICIHAEDDAFHGPGLCPYKGAISTGVAPGDSGNNNNTNSSVSAAGTVPCWAVSRITMLVVCSSTPCGTRVEACSRVWWLCTKSPSMQTLIGLKGGNFLAYTMDPIQTTALVGTRRTEPTASAHVSCGGRMAMAKVSSLVWAPCSRFSCSVCKVYAYVRISLNCGSFIFTSGQCATYILSSSCGYY